MKKSKIVPLNIGGTSQQSQQFFGCEVLRSNRKTLALFISHRKVVVRCPHRAPIKEVQDFVNRNQKWIQARLEEESKKNKEKLRIEKNGRIFYRARELTIEYKEGRKQRILINGDRFIIQGHKLNVTKATVQLEDYLIDKASEHNERMSVRIRPAGHSAGCEDDLCGVQIAGLVARRIKCEIMEGQPVHAGERFGIIRFGSRVDVYLPKAYNPLVVAGQRSVAGETVLADARTQEAQHEKV